MKTETEKMNMNPKNLILIPVLIICLVLAPKAQAVVPPPDGGYPGGNTAEGQAALLSLTTGGFNTAVGFLSLRSDTTGQLNTAVGAGTLVANTADANTATGAGALFSNTTGAANTANGAFALFSNTTAPNNTATGSQALFSNSSGTQNTASGVAALFSNTTGSYNTAIGLGALKSNTTADSNTAIGINALLYNTGGLSTACGANALLSNTTGVQNTANGVDALFNNTTGINNTALGVFALENNTTGGRNIALGASAGSEITTAINAICIGANLPGANVNNSCFIANIRGVTTAIGNAIPVVIDSAGQLGTASSSRRFKKEIKPIDNASETILALKPVTFHYKSDKTGTPQFGLIAEEVAEVNPDLVVRDDKGDIYTVRYDAVNAMLLNEFLKEHKKVEEQQAKIAQLTQEMAAIVAHAKEQDSKIQKVSAQIELDRSVTPLADISH